MRDELTMTLPARPGSPAVEWIVAEEPVAYADAVAEMERHVAAIAAGTARERIWLVQHPPLYTAGTSARTADLLDPRFPVFETGRGGQYTYHGPGQRVAYVMLDLERRTKDLRRFVAALEAWLILTLASFNIRAFRRHDLEYLKANAVRAAAHDDFLAVKSQIHAIISSVLLHGYARTRSIAE
jgi:lipoyl(octanoyl) transferase